MKHTKRLVLCLLALVLTVCCVCTACGEGSNDPELDAWVYAKMAVEDRLKAPSTADFCSYTSADIDKLSENRYRVQGYVDAENSFGAMIRSDFSVTLRLTDDGATIESCSVY